MGKNNTNNGMKMYKFSVSLLNSIKMYVTNNPRDNFLLKK